MIGADIVTLKPAPPMSGQAAQGLERAVYGFDAWLQRRDGDTHDPYDLWSTGYGVLARRLYYWNRVIGGIFAAPVGMLDALAPRAARLALRRRPMAMADAELAIGFLDLHAATGETGFLDKAKRLAERLLEQSIPGWAGHCWGYPFDWQNSRGLWPRGTPFATVTPYGYRALAGLYDATGNPAYAKAALSAARFMLSDLKQTPLGKCVSASSYSPRDASQVINAGAYRAWTLMDAWHRSGDTVFREAAAANIAFVLRQQRNDGSWLYAAASSADAFIDNFHTCFVLQHLAWIHALEPEERLKAAIVRGYEYYLEALLDARGEPRPYARAPRLRIVDRELYDYAEAIRMGVALREIIPEAIGLSRRLAAVVSGRYQLADGHFVTRVYRFGKRDTMPYLRWPQAPLFSALAALLRVERACAE